MATRPENSLPFFLYSNFPLRPSAEDRYLAASLTLPMLLCTAKRNVLNTSFEHHNHLTVTKTNRSDIISVSRTEDLFLPKTSTCFFLNLSWFALLISLRKVIEKNKFSLRLIFCTPWKHYKQVLRNLIHNFFTVSFLFLQLIQHYTATSCKHHRILMVQKENLLAQFSEWLQWYRNNSSIFPGKCKTWFLPFRMANWRLWFPDFETCTAN